MRGPSGGYQSAASAVKPKLALPVMLTVVGGPGPPVTAAIVIGGCCRDQSGRHAEGSLLTCVRPVPSVLMTARPALLLSTSFLPSGDHANPQTPVEAYTRRTLLPSS